MAAESDHKHGEEKAVDAARGRLLVLGAGILWSTSGVLLKSPPIEAIPLSDRGPLVACYRALIAAAILFPFVGWNRVRFRWALVPMVASFAAMNVLFVTGMTMTSAAAAIFLQYTATAWAFVFGAAFLGERIARTNFVALSFCLAGIIVIVAGGWNSADILGILLALGSGMAYGGVIVTLRTLRSEDSAWLVALNQLVAGAVLVPWVVSRGLHPVGLEWGPIAALGIVQMALPYLLFARGVAHLSTQEAGLITLVEAILNPLWVWLLWREPVPASTLFGGALIVTGLLSRYVRFPIG